MVTEEDFTLENLKDIEYVAVRVRLKKDRTMMLNGLFAGYRPLVGKDSHIIKKADMFVWLMKGERIHILSVDHWEIANIEIRKKDNNSASIHTIPGQEKNIARLKAIVEAMEACKMTDPSGLIDITQYNNIPKSLQEELDKYEKLAKRSQRRSGAAGHGTGMYDEGGYSHIHGAAGYNKSSVKKPETSEIKRTTKYAVAAAITRMSTKVEQLRQGIYKPPKLKSIAADKEDEDKESES